MKQIKIFLMVLCLLAAFCLPVDAACPYAKKTGATCDKGCNLTPCTKDTCLKSCSETKSTCSKTCNVAKSCTKNTCSATKKATCSAVKKKTCYKATTTKNGCNICSKCTSGCNNPIIEKPIGNVTPVDPKEGSGISIVKLCKNNVCTIGGDGKVITLVNYKNTTDPTYEQLIAFLKEDKTDEHPYTPGYVCSDFARTLHNNAEKAGIRAGYIGVASCNHAFNLFNTADKGIIYIDCTGQVKGGTLLDKELSYKKGQSLTGKYLFREGTVEMACTAGEGVVYW